jgi:hypothetical protein
MLRALIGGRRHATVMIAATATAGRKLLIASGFPDGGERQQHGHNQYSKQQACR